MLRIVDGELRVKLEDDELNTGLVPVILKRYEMVLAEKAIMMFEIQRLKTEHRSTFHFSDN